MPVVSDPNYFKTPSIYSMLKSYYEKLIRMLPVCNDAGNIILQYCMDIVVADIKKNVLKAFVYNTVVYIETEWSAHLTWTLVPNQVVKSIFAFDSSLLSPIIHFPQSTCHGNLIMWLEKVSMEISHCVFRNNPKCICVKNFSVSLDNTVFNAVPIVRDSISVFEAFTRDYYENYHSTGDENHWDLI